MDDDSGFSTSSMKEELEEERECLERLESDETLLGSSGPHGTIVDSKPAEIIKSKRIIAELEEELYRRSSK
jgi:hypothetical protein